MYKKLSIILIFVATSCFVKAQSKKVLDSTKHNEIHLNVLSSLSYGFVEISFERILTESSALGLSAFVPVIKHDTYAYGFIPYYRQYFGKKVANGLFIEGNLGLLARKDNYKLVYDNYGGYSSLTTTAINYGYGVAAGVKIKSTSNFIVTIYGGVVRLFNTNGDNVFPRAGVTMGKRF
jgi:hypothetical protein